ncbi:MAG: copper-translocating P-type ATPase [Melioribacteraceae bacterium]|nr:MAG: copper-translocating P-type ATPase [Melioribacteraceae bacterium]
MAKYTYPVEGMTCAACVARVEKSVNKIDGLENINVNFATEELSFETPVDNPDIRHISEVIEKSGYKLIIPSTSSTGGKADSTVNTEENNKGYVDLKNEFLFALVLTLPIFIISMFYDFQFFRDIWQLDRQYTNNILLILTTPVIFISGKRFYSIFWKNLKQFNTEMNSLVAIGTGAAFGYSTFATLFPELLLGGDIEPHVYFETAAVIITLILLGRLLEARARKKTSSAIRELLALRPKTALLKIDGEVKEVSSDTLKTGDVVIIKPGAKIPADGKIISGNSNIDESMVTGESLPVEKETGMAVTGGTINISGSFEYVVTETGENSFLGQIINLVREAQGSKVPIQRLADKIASWFTPIVIIISFITFAGWLLAGYDVSIALVNFVSVLIVACPCALGLATPTAIMVGTGLGAKHGIIIKDGESLETAKKITTMIFDKTGTLTKGTPEVTEQHNIIEGAEDYLVYAAALENKSEHPLANAIIKYSSHHEGIPSEIEDFKNHPGFGVSGTINNKRIAAGSKKLAKELNIDFQSAEQKYTGIAKSGKTPVVIFVDSEPAIILGIEDPLKEEAVNVISSLHNKGIQTAILSGDNIRTVKALAKNVGIDKAHGEVLPSIKSEIVEKYKTAGEITAMVGDGINDAPALAAAHVGISLGSGTDVAIESSKITLLRNNLADLISTLDLSRYTINTIKQNLFWAFIYNVIGIPLAAVGMLNPMLAALAMSFSSVSVVSNSLRLRRKKI